MPGRAGSRRLVPISKKGGSIEFRFVAGKLNVEPRLEEKTTTWASCKTKESTTPPQFVTRTMGHTNPSGFLGSSIIGIGIVSRTQSTALRGSRTVQTVQLLFGKSSNLGLATYKPKFTKFSPSCIDDKLSQKK